MNTMRNLLPASLLLTAGSASAAIITVTDPVATPVPDGFSTGVVRSLTVPGGAPILSAEVDINISGIAAGPTFLGDLYIYLNHGTDLAVLVNRAGSRVGTPAGYGDNQPMTVTFSTLGAEDFHNYRLSLTGSHTNPLTGPLAGIWQPDGRAVDPAAVLDTSPRTAGLDVFNGDDPSGTWTLFAADLSSGAAHQINSWTLRLDTIPEPGSAALTLLLTTALTFRRRPR